MIEQSLLSSPALNFFPHFATVMLCSVSKQLREYAKQKGNMFWRNKLINDCHVYCDEPKTTEETEKDYYFQRYITRLNVDFQQEYSRHGSSGPFVPDFSCLFVQSCGAVARSVEKRRGVKQLYNLPSNTKCVAVCETQWHSLCLLDNGVVLDWGEFKINETIFPPTNHKYIAVAGGDRHYLALRDDGVIHSWGDPKLGKWPQKKRFKAIAACDSYTVGLLYNGTIMAWGTDFLNKLDMPLKDDNRKIVAISANVSQICGLLDDGTIACWHLIDGYSGGRFESKIVKQNLKLREKVIAINGLAVLLENGDVEFPFKQGFERKSDDETRTSTIPNGSTFFKIGWFKQNTFFYNRKY